MPPAPRGGCRSTARRVWADQQSRNLASAKVESATLVKEQAAQDEQEFTAYASRVDEAQREGD